MTFVVTGGFGAAEAAPIDRPDRSGRIAEIYEGASVVQRMVIARQALA